MSRVPTCLSAALLLVAACAALGSPAAEADALRKSRNGGYLGLFLREADGAVTVDHLHPGSMAARAGFEPGDVVRTVNGERVENGDAFVRWLWSGRQLTIGVVRDGASIEIRTSTRDLDALPQLDDRAPGFKLPAKDGHGTYSLDAVLSKGRPVVLVFGSFT